MKRAGVVVGEHNQQGSRQTCPRCGMGGKGGFAGLRGGPLGPGRASIAGDRRGHRPPAEGDGVGVWDRETQAALGSFRASSSDLKEIRGSGGGAPFFPHFSSYRGDWKRNRATIEVLGGIPPVLFERRKKASNANKRPSRWALFVTSLKENREISPLATPRGFRLRGEDWGKRPFLPSSISRTDFKRGGGRCEKFAEGGALRIHRRVASGARAQKNNDQLFFLAAKLVRNRGNQTIQ